MSTIRTLMAGALRLLGVIATGEPLEAAHAQDALTALNAWLDSLSLERLTVYVLTEQPVPLVAGKHAYSWGVPAGDIASARPLRLEPEALVRFSGTNYDLPISVVEQTEYARLSLKGQTMRYPQLVSYAPTYPLGTLLVWPVPLETNTLLLRPWQPIERFASLDTVVAFPPGYERLLRYGLAIELAPEYGIEPSGLVLATYAEAKSNVKRVNTVVPELGLDPAFCARGRGAWDAASGTDWR